MGSRVASAVGLAVAGMMLSASLNAGPIINTNGANACGTDPDAIACVGAWDLTNVDVQLYHADGSVFGTFDPLTGAYSAMIAGDTFASLIYDDNAKSILRARLTGKDWPVGEPTSIKAINNDTATKNGKPQNCLINTSYLEGTFLDSATPAPVICSSPFQSHKRFKVAMLPSTVNGVAPGAEGNPIDLVFNLQADDAVLRAYQVFSKINNYTGVRLKGYRIVVGTGKGAAFQSADTLGIEDKLFISLGIDEGRDNGGVPDGSDLFNVGDGLATFSHGLFGAPDKHFPDNGFFDSRPAGFTVAQGCTTGVCDKSYLTAFNTPAQNTDTIFSTGTMPSNYAGPAVLPLTAPLFGDWVPAEWAPKGIFFDHDNDPKTDPVLQAWWNGTAWIKNFDSGFAAVNDTEFNTWASNPLYYIDIIEDVLNLGLNYIVHVGDGVVGGKFTIRIIPVVADTQVPPAYVGTTPRPLVPTTPVPPVVAPVTGGGGGCTIGGNAPLDPTLPVLLAAALGFMGWRRVKAGK